MKLRQFNVLGRKKCSPFSVWNFFFRFCDVFQWSFWILLWKLLIATIKYKIFCHIIKMYFVVKVTKHTTETVKTVYKKIIFFTTSDLSRDVADAVARYHAYVSLHEKEHVLYRLAGGEFSRWRKRNSDSVVCRSLLHKPELLSWLSTRDFVLVNNSLQVDIMSGFAFYLDVISRTCRGKGFCDKVFLLSV